MLIDVIYDSGVKLIWSGEVGPKELFTDMFVQGLSNLNVVVESDDLTPFDPQLEEELSLKSREAAESATSSSNAPTAVHHIQHHIPSPRSEPIQFGKQKDGPDDDDDNTFQIMKGETAAFRDLDFAVRRAISRLIEMSGKQYMEAASRK